MWGRCRVRRRARVAAAALGSIRPHSAAVMTSALLLDTKIVCTVTVAAIALITVVKNANRLQIASTKTVFAVSIAPIPLTTVVKNANRPQTASVAPVTRAVFPLKSTLDIVKLTHGCSLMNEIEAKLVC